MDIEDYLTNRRLLRNIKRFGMEKVLHPQNLADHGFNVANLFYLLCKQFGFQVDAKELHAVMNHDFAECFTGDLNLTIKNKIPELWEEVESQIIPKKLYNYTDEGLKKTLKSDIYNIFLFADAFEAYLYCEDEVTMGNQLLIHALKNYNAKLTNMNPEMFHVLKNIRKQIKEK
jgi:5'-deoxynucleotidase YfbR-like HD superfamily hydrolase